MSILETNGDTVILSAMSEDSEDTRELPFWLTKSLRQMSDQEWESLCDGCGLCCMVKLENASTGEVVSTEVACRLLDLHTCRCTDYPNRQSKVPGCLRLTPDIVPQLYWLPETCGYRRVHEAKDLPEWHPLRGGDPEAVHRAGISVRGKAFSEADIEDLEQVLSDWYDFYEADDDQP